MALGLATRLLSRVRQQCGPASYSAPRPNPNRRAAADVRALLYFAAVQRRKSPAKISVSRSDLRIYGDSNPRPLACHQHAGHPPKCIGAGHRPRACRAGRLGPGRLLYFRAVRPVRLDIDDLAGEPCRLDQAGDVAAVASHHVRPQPGGDLDHRCTHHIRRPRPPQQLASSVRHRLGQGHYLASAQQPPQPHLRRGRLT
jgi:hypothetical protein